MADTKYDYSNKSEAALEKMMEKGKKNLTILVRSWYTSCKL